MPWIAILLVVPAVAWGLWKARRDYRLHGRLTLSGLFAVCAMLFVCNLNLDAAIDQHWPRTTLDWIGVAISAAGLLFAIVGIVNFRSMTKVLCLDSGQLTVRGLYRWSRNPQYVGYFVFLAGFSLIGGSWWCIPALLLCAVVLHLLVLIEEEHLERVFGDAYRVYRSRVGRYLGSGGRRRTADD